MQLTFDLLGQVSGFPRFSKKYRNGARQRTVEFVAFERSNERIVGRSQDFRGQSVEVPAVPAIQLSAPTGEGERFVANGADPVLRLPIPAALDGRSCMKCVVDAVPEQFVCSRREFVCPFDRLPEQQPELRSAGAELGCWCE